DLDAVRFGALRPWHRHRQHATLEASCHAIGVNSGGKGGAIAERAGAPAAMTQHTGALSFPDLPAYRQLAIADIYLQVLAARARQVHFEDPRIVGLFDVHRRRPVLTPDAFPPRCEEPAHHPVPHLVELTERIDVRTPPGPWPGFLPAGRGSVATPDGYQIGHLWPP